MNLKDTIEADLRTAMKARETARVGVLRMLKARVQEAHVALRAKDGADATLSDEAVLEVISRHAKQVRESLEGAQQAGRQELCDQASAELVVIESYLPEQLTEDGITSIVTDAIAEAGASSPRDMGAVMKLVVPRTKGRADGKKVSEAVKHLLSGG
jgi:uncharacterized protein YqeY